MTLVDVVRPHRSDRPNLSILKNSHARAIRFNTLTAICDALGWHPWRIPRSPTLIDLQRSPAPPS